MDETAEGGDAVATDAETAAEKEEKALLNKRSHTNNRE